MKNKFKQGYIEWRKFLGVIEKAKEACKNSYINIKDHFGGSDKMVKIGSETEIEDFISKEINKLTYKQYNI
ncbi:MAG: hypothetical protein V2A62_02850 [Candidatus Woesearchaeota archaeon]